MREVGKKRKAVHELKGESPLRAYCENGAKLSIQLYDSDSPDAEWAHLILILDNHEALGDISNLKLLTPEMWPLVSEAVKTIPLTGGTKTIQVQQKKEIIIHILPASYGRHNSSSRCHALRAFLKGQKAHLLSSRSDFLICSSSAEHAYAQALEISRHFPLFSSKTNKSSSAREAFVRIRAPHGNLDILNHLPHIADGIRHCQSLVDAPASILNVDAYVQECRQVAQRTGCSIEVITGYDLEDRGFGGIWGVGQAAEQLPALVILSSSPKSDQKSICLVGKGIVYDTGGLSIKVSGGMVGMKRDMGGSAAVLGAFEALMASKVAPDSTPIHALLCIADNSVSASSIRPDDILTMYSGKTVEVNNTDAEGRLVLADGVSYASKHLHPRVIIDMATLTGAQGVATGRKHGAIYTNDESLEVLAVKCGQLTGDLVHPMPYCPEFFAPEFTSEVADMKNSVSDRTNAQVCCAAQFIGSHIESHLSDGGSWLHIDMAYPVHDGERATGYGVALLYELVKGLLN